MDKKSGCSSNEEDGGFIKSQEESWKELEEVFGDEEIWKEDPPEMETDTEESRPVLYKSNQENRISRSNLFKFSLGILAGLIIFIFIALMILVLLKTAK